MYVFLYVADIVECCLYWKGQDHNTTNYSFESLKEHDVFNGQSTGKFTLTLTLDEKSATNLESEGVKIKDYEELLNTISDSNK